MNYGLSSDHINRIKSIFISHHEIEAVLLYGSRAKGDYKSNSDIDLTLKGNKLSPDLLNKISIELDDLLLPYTFDLSLHAHLENDDIIEHINRVGIIFYENNRSINN
jgi:predicted nucleotidyltransferase